MIWLGEKVIFPPCDFASEEGILALGGDLSEERLLCAYKNGIFPWYTEGEPIVWYCPQKRMVLYPNEIKISKSMRSFIRKTNFTISENKSFSEVIYNCKNIDRKDGFGTWITNDMEKAYINLHNKGYAKSIEVWSGEKLVGGLYGIEINNIFCGESMFSKISNTSKLAFIHLAQNYDYNIIDCQVYNSHLESLGAKEIDRDLFIKVLKE